LTDPDTRRWQVLALLGATFFMTILDGTIMLTALPSIEQDLGLTGTGLQWTVTAYALAFGGLLLLAGRAADLLGRRRVFLVGVALRLLSSLLCGLAWSGGVLVAARALQGVSAAVVAPAALSLLTTTFPEGPERNKALGIWGSLGGVGATAGLLLGGVITEGLGWQWVFLINLPVGIAVLAVAPLLLRESRDPGRARSFDAAGALTMTAALVLLVYAIVGVPEVGWTGGRTTLLLVAGAALAALFVLVETRSTNPLVPFRVLGSRTLIGGNLVILSAGMAVDGMLITLTLHVQQVLGWSPLRFGLLAAVMTATSVAGGLLSQRLATRVGVRPVAAAGAVGLVAACLLLTGVSTGSGSVAVMLVALLLFGAGMGGTFVPSQIAALAGVARHVSGLAAGLVDTSFSIGTALGVAICSSVALARAEAAGGPAPLAAISGHRAAFAAAAILAALGLLAALALFRRHPAPEPVLPEPVPVDSGLPDPSPTGPAPGTLARDGQVFRS
jgi:EmrB/QacA subfamily drug resistance transporter